VGRKLPEKTVFKINDNVIVVVPAGIVFRIIVDQKVLRSAFGICTFIGSKLMVKLPKYSNVVIVGFSK